MSKKIKVNENCIACGMCLVSPFMEELPDGKAQAKGTGVLPADKESEFGKVINDCPAHAISLENAAQKSKAQILADAEKKIAAFHLHVPDCKELGYDKKYADFSVPVYAPGENQAKYSSYNQAKSAAEDAINQVMFSQKSMIVRNIVNNYCMDKLAPYTRYEEMDRNFYYSANKEAEQILKEIAGELQAVSPYASISGEMLKIKSRPDLSKDYEIKVLKEDLLYQSDVIISREMQGEYYQLSFYVQDCDIDSEEVYAGRGLFGGDKYVDKYYFYNTKAAFEEIAKDLRSACDGSFNDVIVDGCALSMVKSLVEKYEKRLKEELHRKVQEFSK